MVTWPYLILLVDFLNNRFHAYAHPERTVNWFDKYGLGFPTTEGQDLFRESATESWSVNHCHLLMWLFDRNHGADNDRLLHKMLVIMNVEHPLYEALMLQYIKVRLAQKRTQGHACFQFSTQSPLKCSAELLAGYRFCSTQLTPPGTLIEMMFLAQNPGSDVRKLILLINSTY